MRLTTLAATAALLSVTGHSAGAAELTGQEVFERHCVHCHGASNEAVGTLQLARTRGQDKALLTERRDLPPEYIRIVVRHGLRAMPAFVPSDLTDTQLQALTDYLTRQRM
jgi:mono/diheme cytochrome c family protein